MKSKILLLLLLLLIFITSGCNGKTVKTLKCVYENTKEGTEYKTVITAEVNKKDIIKDATAVITFENESLAKEMCNNFSVVDDSKNVKCEDKTITLKKYHKSLAGKSDLTKDVFLEYMDNHNYTCE